MTSEVKKIALEMFPSSLRPGMDFDMVDVKACNYEYSSDKLADYAQYDNSIVAIQIKHKSVDNLFWITLFKGAQARVSDAAFAIATFDCSIDQNESGPSANGTVYETDKIITSELDNGGESIDEIVSAFNYYWFEQDETSEYEPLIYDDCELLSDFVFRIKQAKKILINMEIDRATPNPKRIYELEEYLNEAKELYRQTQGEAIAIEMYADKNIPDKLKCIMSEFGVSSVRFEDVVDSPDYMPSHARIVRLFPNESIEPAISFIVDCDDEFEDLDHGDDILHPTVMATNHNISLQDASNIIDYMKQINAMYDNDKLLIGA